MSRTNHHLDYPRCKAKYRWCSVGAHCNVLSMEHLLPSIVVFTIIRTYWMASWLIETLPFGKAEPSNIIALVAHILLKLIHVAKCFLSPAMLLFINQYSHATAHYSPILFLFIKLSLKQHKDPVVNTSTHFVLLFPIPLINSHFHCIDCQPHDLSLILSPTCWPNHSGNILCGTRIPLHWAFQIPQSIV